jgi:hypothetical protein
MPKSFGVVFLVALMTWALLGLFVGRALGNHVQCGDAIGCGIANGHNERAFPVEDGHDRVTVRNGTVRGFYVGLGLQSAIENGLCLYPWRSPLTSPGDRSYAAVAAPS